MLQLFNKEWHKLQFSVRRDTVDIYIDCQLTKTVQLQPRGPIDVNGDIVMGKTEDGTTVPVSNVFLIKYYL